MISYADYVRSVQANNYIDWDVNTITAADYTVEFNIEPEFYYRFLNKFHDPSNPISEIGQFRLFLKDELEARLTEMPALGFDGTEGDEAPVNIAMITFAFNNSQVINWLKERGTYIKNENWDKFDKI